MRWKSTLLTIALAGLALSACGPKTAELSMTLTDFSFDPTEASLPAGAEVTLTLTNNSSIPHNWVLMEHGYTANLLFTPQDQDHVYFKTSVPAGETQIITFTAPEEPGSYQLICTVPGHLSAGMEGRIFVGN